VHDFHTVSEDSALKFRTGIPTAWMISSNAQEETIAYFLLKIKARNPDIKPKWIMSDKDQAQMNSICRVYPDLQLLLCWWHVLHAWQQHFVTSHYPELWDLLKGWIRMTDPSDFAGQWEKIKRAAPASVVQYLETEWLGNKVCNQPKGLVNP
jgi:hypothetical protein